MLRIQVSFLHGSFRADPDGTAHTGLAELGEWPPSPSRLFAALVAADGTGVRSRWTDGAGLRLLEGAAAPTITASSTTDIVHNRMQSRFVVQGAGGLKGKGVQEYVGHTATLVRPGVRVEPRSRLVTYRWDVTASSHELDCLRLRAARVGYLGCADSPVEVCVDNVDEVGAVGEDRVVYTANGEGPVVLSVPALGTLEALDHHFSKWQQLGPNVRRSHTPALRHLVRYGTSEEDTPTRSQPATVLWFLLDKRVSGRRVVSLTGLLRSALLATYQQVVGDPPEMLHGHGISGKGYLTARYLALPDVGFRHSRGQIHGVAIWLPPGVDPDVLAGTRRAAASIQKLTGRGLNVTLAPHDGRQRPVAASAARWTGPATKWSSAFPVVFERRVKALTLAEVSRWCQHAGLPEPIAFRSGRGPLLHGGVDLAPNEVNRPGRPARPYGHVEVEFASPVLGPVVLGAGRQFGLGLMAPLGAPGEKT